MGVEDTCLGASPFLRRQNLLERLVVLEEPGRPILQPFRVAAVGDAVLTFEMGLPIVCLDFIEDLRRVPKSCVLGEDLLFFGSRKTGVGFECMEQLDRSMIRLELSNLPDRSQSFVAYSVVSLSLWYVLGRSGIASLYGSRRSRSFSRAAESFNSLCSCGSATT